MQLEYAISLLFESAMMASIRPQLLSDIEQKQ